jgi:ribosomal RNA-processing protein 17
MNLDVLTQSHSAIASKQRAKRTQVKEVIFDEVARHDFLTGFHKRKLAKTEAARKKALEREKQQRLEDRREQRRSLRERAAENAAEVEKAYGAISDPSPDDQEWQGISQSSDSGEQKEQAYEDEHVLATVAIVEDFDPDTFLHGPMKPVSDPEPSHTAAPSHAQTVTKTKSKKIRYLTKEARNSERRKQRDRRTEKAERAGGKASRRKGQGGKRR